MKGESVPLKKKRYVKQVSEEEKVNFYEQLKDSVYVGRKINIDDDDSLPTGQQEMADQMKALDVAIQSKDATNTYNYCLIGRNLTELKKTIGGKGNAFINFVKQYLPQNRYNRSQIYFLMKLHEFALEYNKIMCVTIPIGILRSNFKLVRELIEADKDYDWKSL